MEEERLAVSRAATGSNSTPLIHVDERKRGNAKRLSSPERFRIKQLIASGAVSAADVSADPGSSSLLVPRPRRRPNWHHRRA